MADVDVSRPPTNPRLVGARRQDFPALSRLGASLRRAEIPIVLQTTALDCGAACLAMAIGYHGRDIPLEEVCAALSTERGGISAARILEAARFFDLRGRGV